MPVSLSVHRFTDEAGVDELLGLAQQFRLQPGNSLEFRPLREDAGAIDRLLAVARPTVLDRQLGDRSQVLQLVEIDTLVQRQEHACIGSARTQRQCKRLRHPGQIGPEHERLKLRSDDGDFQRP